MVPSKTSPKASHRLQWLSLHPCVDLFSGQDTHTDDHRCNGKENQASFFLCCMVTDTDVHQPTVGQSKSKSIVSAFYLTPKTNESSYSLCTGLPDQHNKHKQINIYLVLLLRVGL